MRIGLLTHSTRPRGSVVQALGLAEALARQGERVTVIGAGFQGDRAFYRPVDPAVEVRVTPVEFEAGAAPVDRAHRICARLRAAVATGSFDLLHAHDAIAAGAADGRCVRTVHHPGQFADPDLRAWARAAAAAPVTVYASQATADDREGEPTGEVAVIPGGVDEERFIEAAHPAAQQARESWRARIGGDRYLLSVGGVEARKDPLLLLDVVARLAERQPGWRLALTGVPSLDDHTAARERFDASVAERGLQDFVVHLGEVPHQQYPALVAGATIMLLTWTDGGFSGGAMEGLAAGVPVVLTDHPGFVDVFGPTVRYGNDFQLLSRLIRVAFAGDPNRQRRGRELTARHAFAAAAERHRRLYQRVAHLLAGAPSG